MAGKGFSHTPNAGEFRTASSWGRTRRPKNLNGASSTAQAQIGKVGGAKTADPTVISDGHVTENQRYLHLALIADATVATRQITVWAWSHAFETWAILRPVGTPATNAVIGATASQANYSVFEISGVDKVYFQDTGGGGNAIQDGDEFYAACSTF